MILKVFSVLDTKGDVFLPPFFMAATGQAIRAFPDLANDPNTVVSRHPGDYRLVQLGEFDDASGRLSSIEPMVLLGYAQDFKALGPVTPLSVVSNGS